jgi:hypothetical protein
MLFPQPHLHPGDLLLTQIETIQGFFPCSNVFLLKDGWKEKTPWALTALIAAQLALQRPQTG